MELSLLCDVEVMLIIVEKEGKRYTKYQSSTNNDLFLRSLDKVDYSILEEFTKEDVFIYKFLKLVLV